LFHRFAYEEPYAPVLHARENSVEKSWGLGCVQHVEQKVLYSCYEVM